MFLCRINTRVCTKLLPQYQTIQKYAVPTKHMFHHLEQVKVNSLGGGVHKHPGWCLPLLSKPDLDTPIVDYMCFQMRPLQSVFLLFVNFVIQLKWVYLDHFIPKSVNSGDRVQTAQEHVISLFLPSLGEIRLGDFRLLVIYRIVYFGMVFDLVFQICINSHTYVFSNSNRSLIGFMAVFFSMKLFDM